MIRKKQNNGITMAEESIIVSKDLEKENKKKVKKEKKQKKDKKRIKTVAEKEMNDGSVEMHHPTSTEEEEEKDDGKKKMRKEKKRKLKHRNSHENEMEEVKKGIKTTSDDDKKDSKNSTLDEKKELRRAKKAAKKAEKETLLQQVPTKDEHGISYTKIQIRRMMRRVKAGLPPVPTEEEERERLRQISIEKKEEEDELAGMLFQRKGEEDYNDEEEEKDDQDEVSEHDDDDDNDDNVNADKEESTHQEEEEEEEEETKIRPMKKKKCRSKAVPADYVCMACKNKHQPAHWIYDCPDKIFQPGTNHVSKKNRGIHNPSDKKVFVSGLPFEIKVRQLHTYFENEHKCGKIAHVKLLTFDDSKRCKGQAFLSFESEDGAKKALKLNGNVVDWKQENDDDNDPMSKKKKKSKKGMTEKKEKQLRLSVSKVHSRANNTKKANPNQ